MRGLIALFLVSASLSAHSQTTALLLFGGEGHKTFLGCLNCGQYDSGSVCNAYGPHGSKYNVDSIWNGYGNFGSTYSSSSPWNTYSAEPPAIVDKDGNFYGYMTANVYLPKRTQIKPIIALLDAAADDLDAAADAFCGR